MKRLFMICIALAAAATAAAQSRHIAVTGGVVSNGNFGVVEPESTIVVDLTVEHTRISVGPYARYAQKYLGVRAPLSDKSIWSLKGAKIALRNDEALYAPAAPAPAESREESLLGSATEFARLLPSRTDSRIVSEEAAAAEAASMIFSLRKHRIELITGEAGENVFGGGLAAALKTIDDYEKACQELFFGKQTVTVETVRLTVRPASGKFGYILGRFSEKEGLVPPTDLSGDMLMLQIEPSGDTSLNYVVEADPKAKRTVECRVADYSTCILTCGTEHVTSAVLPLYEFGRTIRVEK